MRLIFVNTDTMRHNAMAHSVDYKEFNFSLIFCLCTFVLNCFVVSCSRLGLACVILEEIANSWQAFCRHGQTETNNRVIAVLIRIDRTSDMSPLWPKQTMM